MKKLTSTTGINLKIEPVITYRPKASKADILSAIIKIGIILSLLLILLLAGCQVVLEHSERELADHPKTLQISRNRIPVTTDHIAFTRGTGKAEELSAKTNDAMDEYLIITADPNAMTDFELVYSLGLGVQIYEACLKAAIEITRFWP